MRSRRHFEINGIVQGVGFRPFVYSLATRLALCGFVFNHARGVTIEAEGEDAALEELARRLISDAPALSRIDTLEAREIAMAGDERFTIRASIGTADAFALVPADIATCADCAREFRDPADRRAGYPFTNCTHCGPRYTIIEDVPYDRAATTMSEFAMCADCEREYRDASNRRFHAQPNACPVCGPWVELWDRKRMRATRADAVVETRRLLRAGALVAIKGLGGFHLACDAFNDASVRLLRERKRRSDKPFAVMVPDVEAAERFCRLTPADRAALEDPRRPIVIVERRADSGISAACAPGNQTLGVMLPYTPLHFLLMADFPALVMTSGNISEEPIVSRNEEVAARLHPLCDAFLLHNRRIRTRVDDSVVRVFGGRPRLLRRSRGYAPAPLDLYKPLRHVLAVGGELKSTFCLTRDHYAILSQHIGDMENYETLEFFRETLEHMERFFRVRPEAVAYDLHPGYLSTRFARQIEGVRLIGVQHHHAHVAACAAENAVEGPVTGVAFDGTGFGTDGHIWGGEVLVVNGAAFERRAHFRYVPMAGGDAAVREPWRMALAYALDAGVEIATRPQGRVVEQMIAKGINTALTSSCGRLFDAVASLAGVHDEVNFEGQAAMELESIAGDDYRAYSYEFDGEEIDFRPMIHEIVEGGEPAAVISSRFHATLADVIVEVCRRVALPRVCLTGGTFQNWRLLELATTRLRDAGFEVYLHEHVPPNDGGLALGQAVIANAILSE